MLNAVKLFSSYRSWDCVILSIENNGKLIQLNIKRIWNRMFKVPMSNIYRWSIWWMTRVNDFTSVRNKSNVRRIGFKGSTILPNNIELDIVKWIHDRNSKDLHVSHALVSLHCHSTLTTNCKYSTGWFARFKKRHCLSQRRFTSYSHSPHTLPFDNSPF